MRVLLWGATAAIAATAAAHTLAPFPRFLIAQLGVTVIVVLSLNILMGVVGLISLATAAFMGVGGYAMLILMMQFHIPFLPAVVAAVVVGGALGWLLGLVSLRLEGMSLAIVTFGFVVIFGVLVRQGGSMTGGGYGRAVPPIEVPGLGRLDIDVLTDACVFLSVVAVTLSWSLNRSRVGRTWFAIKDNETAAEIQGVNVGVQKALAFASTSALASFAGVLE